jgi:hypothetical protein
MFRSLLLIVAFPLFSFAGQPCHPVHHVHHHYQVFYFVGASVREQAATELKGLEPTQDAIEPVAATLSTTCAKCHSGKLAKGKLVLDGTVALSQSQAFGAIRAISSGKMPKNAKLSPAQTAALIRELLSLTEGASP